MNQNIKMNVEKKTTVGRKSDGSLTHPYCPIGYPSGMKAQPGNLIRPLLTPQAPNRCGVKLKVHFRVTNIDASESVNKSLYSNFR